MYFTQCCYCSLILHFLNTSETEMQTKTVLIFPFELLSHYLRCIELANQYKKEYNVIFCYSEKYKHYVYDAGYSTFYCKGFNPDLVMNCSEKFDFSWLNYEAIESVFLSQINAINKYKPSIVIGDTSPTLKAACEYTNTKYISLMNGYMTKYYSEIRALSRTHPGYKHLVKLPYTVADTITKFAERIAFKIIHRPFKKLRSKYKLNKVNDYLSEMEGDENLICDRTDLFPQNNLPDNYRVIGPLNYNYDYDEKDLLAKLDLQKTTICVCMGSTGNWNELSFLSDPYYHRLNIITAGDECAVISGPHIISKKFINMDAVLPYCSLMICHGGNGTIYKGINHNVYMLCLTSHFEQEWNVQMLERFGLGKLINCNAENEIKKSLLKLNNLRYEKAKIQMQVPVETM